MSFAPRCSNVRIRFMGRWSRRDRATDGDMVDFALSLANSYFTGALLESVKTAAGREMHLLMRRTLLTTDSGHPFSGATAK